MMKPNRLIFAAVLAAALPNTAHALDPDEIAVIFNTASPTSLQVAQHYMEARKIPMNNLIGLACDPGESTTEQRYRTIVVPQLLKALGDKKLLPDPKAGVKGIKCLVTTYGVPLKISSYAPTAAENVEIAAYQKQLDATVADLQAQLQAYERMAAPPPPLTAPATTSQPAEKVTWQSLLPKLSMATGRAAGRIEALPPDQRGASMMQFIQMQQRLAGLNGLLRSVSVVPGTPDYDANLKRMQEMTAQATELQNQYSALLKQKDSPRSRQEMVAVRVKLDGVVGQAQTLDELLRFLHPEQTEASFDNELALALADQSYSRALWIMNPTNVETFAGYQRSPNPPMPTLMVARIDGATPAKAIELIDTALKVEKTGLEGKLYFDARGLNSSDGYGTFDADIRKAADWMKQHSTIEVVLDNTPELFAAKDAPNCAAYCGWYSVRSYKDSCQWLPGGIGYHVASFEMVTLHDPKETGWVVNLLNKGFAGTLGPIDEPYLTSFPKPSLFFPLLMSGEFTQGEVWHVTSPMVSWRVGFVGDPLYNPYKTKPRVKLEDLSSHPLLRNAFTILSHDPNRRPATNAAQPR